MNVYVLLVENLREQRTKYYSSSILTHTSWLSRYILYPETSSESAKEIPQLDIQIPETKPNQPGSVWQL